MRRCLNPLAWMSHSWAQLISHFLLYLNGSRVLGFCLDPIQNPFLFLGTLVSCRNPFLMLAGLFVWYMVGLIYP
uniref:Uncharacterized protein n=1 Tax=Picea glauca TaxID=3330 RepID=A0A101M4J1_PICGL|nr:hypothetical protein ABT39_MTgene598 [Picea glauca]QHR87546.1 hypothetical protein Q903MT_gene1557 [Picea sitchensis]